MNILTPRQAIRAKCIECSGGSTKELRMCPVENCPLWPHRSGKRPRKEIIIQEDTGEKSATTLPSDDESDDTREEEMG